MFGREVSLSDSELLKLPDDLELVEDTERLLRSFFFADLGGDLDSSSDELDDLCDTTETFLTQNQEKNILFLFHKCSESFSEILRRKHVNFGLFG